MHTEHLQNVRPAYVAFGWLVGAMITSALLFGLLALGVLDPARPADGVLTLVATAIGFAVAGWVIGWRAQAAPILYAVFVGLFSVVVWMALNLLGTPLGATTWDVSPASAAGALLLQIVATGLGASVSSRPGRAAARP